MHGQRHDPLEGVRVWQLAVVRAVGRVPERPHGRRADLLDQAGEQLGRAEHAGWLVLDRDDQAGPLDHRRDLAVGRDDPRPVPADADALPEGEAANVARAEPLGRVQRALEDLPVPRPLVGRVDLALHERRRDARDRQAGRVGRALEPRQLVVVELVDGLAPDRADVEPREPELARQRDRAVEVLGDLVADDAAAVARHLHSNTTPMYPGARSASAR